MKFVSSNLKRQKVLSSLYFVLVNLQRMNRESWFTNSYNRCLENFLQAFVPQIISRLKDQPQIAKVWWLFSMFGDMLFDVHRTL